MISLVGYTGFVGSNIYACAGNSIDLTYNSKNIEQAFGTSPDLLIYSGLRAEKFLANSNPEKDKELIVEAEKNIEKINPKNVVLISTIDVFRTPLDVDENSSIETENLHPYGYNRYLLEQWVRKNYPNALIIRLPGLFGKNLKKNFIYDFVNVIPTMLKEDKFLELAKKDLELKDFYNLQDNGFYKVSVGDSDREKLKNKFYELGFSALNFTDSRSKYQFYNLARLWDDIQISLKAGIKILHLATEPVSAGEVYKYLTGKNFVNELAGMPCDYNYKTIFSKIFGRQGDYLLNKEEILRQIAEYIKGAYCAK